MTTPQPPAPPSNPPTRSAIASFGTSGLWALAGALVTSLGFWFVLALGGAGFVCLVGTTLGTTTGRVVVRLTLPVAVTAYAALLIVLGTIDGLPLVWSVMGPIVLAAVVGVCAAWEYDTRGWRLPIGSAVVGCGVASVAGAVKLALHPAARQTPELFSISLLMAAMGVGLVAMGVGVLMNQLTVVGAAAIGAIAMLVPSGVLSVRLLGRAVGLTVAVTGLAIIAVLVLQIRHPGRPARIAMIVSGGVIATAGIAATVLDEVALGVALAVFGSLQVVAGVLLLLGRLLEPLRFPVGFPYWFAG